MLKMIDSHIKISTLNLCDENSMNIHKTKKTSISMEYS